MMGTLLQDLRYAIRMLVKSPGFTMVAVLTLALGIGANTTIFSVVDAVLLKRLPYPDPSRLMVLNEATLNEGDESVSWPDFLDWRAQNSSFEDMAGARQDHSILTGAGTPDQVTTGWVSASLFPLLGARTVMGRTFGTSEDTANTSPTVVLSYLYWRSHFRGDAGILGKTMTLDGKSATVVGVLAPDFKFFSHQTDLYMPIGLKGSDPDWVNRGNHPGLRVLARLKPGISREAALADMDTVTARLDAQYPVTNSGQRTTMMSLYESRFGPVRESLWILLAAVGFVLLIACANVANLLLARAATRRKEFAIRTAIGAGRARLVRQLLTESVLLSITGGALGLAIATWSIGFLINLAPQNIPRLSDTRIDAGVFAFTFGVALLTGILFGLAPALQTSRIDLAEGLNESGRGTTAGRSRQKLRTGLLISEVALAAVTVIGSGLLVRSLIKALDVNPGFRADHVLALDVSLPEFKYKTDAQRTAFFTQTLDRVRALPDVQAASDVFCPPLSGTCWGSIFIFDDRPVPPQSELPHATFNIAHYDYFRSMQIPLVAGRLFTPADTDGKHPVILINETMAKLWWAGQNPLGKRIKQGFPQDKTPFREIVGVVGDLKQDGPDQPENPEVFEPQGESAPWTATLVVRTAADPASLAASVEGAIHAVDPDQPVSHVQPMAQYLDESLASRKFSATLLSLFGALAMALAAIGIYGVMAYSVTQRTHEIGIRMALGASPLNVLKMIVRAGLGPSIAGIGIGLIGSLVFSRWMKSLLFGVSPADPVTLLGVSVLLVGVVLLACYVPARRATHVDPLVALRHE
jgi:putative ABC transport system permease protein